METSVLVPGHPEADSDCLPEGTLVQYWCCGSQGPSCALLGLPDQAWKIRSTAAIPFGSVTFYLRPLVCAPLPGWRCWILTAVLFLDSSALSLRRGHGKG